MEVGTKRANMGEHRVHLPVGMEDAMGKYGLPYDAGYFDRDTLIRMYGKELTDYWLRLHGDEYAGN